MNLMCVGREIAFARGYKLEISPFCTYFETQALISVGQKCTEMHTQQCTHTALIWDPVRKTCVLPSCPNAPQLWGRFVWDAVSHNRAAVFIHSSLWLLTCWTLKFNFPCIITNGNWLAKAAAGWWIPFKSTENKSRFWWRMNTLHLCWEFLMLALESGWCV